MASNPLATLDEPTPTTIADSYLASLPDGYAARYSVLADPHAITRMLDAAEHGLNDRSACEAAGIHPVTLSRWLKHADDFPDSPHASFALAMKTARNRGKLALLKRIKTAAEKPQFWTAAAWTLERTDPEQFALRKDNADTPKVVVQIGAGGGDVKVGVMIAAPSTFASEAVSVTQDLHRLTAATGSDNS